MPTLAIDIGGTKTAAALVDGAELIEHTTWPSPQIAKQAIDRIVRTCLPWTQKANAAGVSFGGPFDYRTQTCIRSMHVSGWDDVRLSARLQQELGIPVITDNDANVAALGEYERLSTGDRDPLLYVTVSTGVGAAIVADGELLRGAHSLAGEIGHLPIGHDRQCSCGQSGCLERVVSGYWIERDYGCSPADFLADQHNYDAWLTYLTHGLWTAVTLIDPAVIVVGGGMASQGDRLREALEAALTRRAEASSRVAPVLALGDATGRTVLIGAALLAKGVLDESR